MLLCYVHNVFTDEEAFQPDADELFSKKLRFSPGDDASKLPTAIANFGELTVLLPQFAGRYLPLEQSYLPKPIKLGYESDNYKFSARRVDPEETRSDVRSTRYSRNDEDVMSIRYRRRQQMEEEAWNRLRASNTDSGRQSPGVLRSPGNSPWSRTVVASGGVTPDENAGEVHNSLEPSAAKVAECARTMNTSQPSEAQPTTLTVPTSGSRRSENNQSSSNHDDSRPLSAIDDLGSFSTNNSRAKPYIDQYISNNYHSAATEQEDDNNATNGGSSGTQVEDNRQLFGNHSGSSRKENFDPQVSKAALKITRKPPLPRQASSEDTSLNEKIENIRAAHEKRRLRNRQIVDPANDQSTAAQSSEENDSDTDPVQPATIAPARFRIISRTSSNYDVPKTVQPSVTTQQPNVPKTAPTQPETPPDTPSLPIPITHYPGEIPPWLLRRRQRFQRSKTNPDMTAVLTAANNYYGTTPLSPVGTTNPSSRVQQLLLERSNRLDSTTQRFIPPPPRQDSTDASNTTDTDTPVNILSDRRSRFRRRSSAANRRDSSADSRISKMLSTKYVSNIDYQGKGKPRLVFGKKGCKDGDLNWPRGIAVISGSDFAVCDSSNHRVCVFNTQGRLLRIFGKYGTGNGQLDSAAGICCNRFKELIVSDRYNHRITIFDQHGQFLSSFGGHGPSNGRFNNPWGVAVDDGGMIYVVDKVGTLCHM